MGIGESILTVLKCAGAKKFSKLDLREDLQDLETEILLFKYEQCKNNVL